MRILVIGLRGFPGVQGGVETHAAHLYPLLARMGCEVHVIVRSSYVKPGVRVWKGVRFHRIWAPRLRGFEALLHTFLGVLYAAVLRPNVLHIHAIGPAVLTPLARLLGLRVVVTHHGADYEREKWGVSAKWLLRQGERWGMKYSLGRIVISKFLREEVKRRLGIDSTLIVNGVSIPALPETTAALAEYGLDARRYVLLVSRIVPEKRHIDLVRAFDEAELAGWKLVLVGGMDPQDDYCKKLMSVAEAVPNVVIAGFKTGMALQELYAHAGVFVLPSSHEGLPIALLEALSYGIPVIASNIPANLEIGLSSEQYFPLGDTQALAEKLAAFAEKEFSEIQRAEIRGWVAEKYDWQKIAEQTLGVYKATVGTG